MRHSPNFQRFPAPGRWREKLILADGRELLMRPIEPLDAEPLRHGFSLLTPDEVRRRFLYPLKEMTPEMAKRLTHLDSDRAFALVLAEPELPGQALIGAVVRASIDEMPANDYDDATANPIGQTKLHSAEFAILVSRFLAGQGLGHYLMRQIVRWARLKRLDQIYGDVLDDNQSMLDLAQTLGFHRQHQMDNPGVTRVILDLQTKKPA